MCNLSVSKPSEIVQVLPSLISDLSTDSKDTLTPLLRQLCEIETECAIQQKALKGWRWTLLTQASDQGFFAAIAKIILYLLPSVHNAATELKQAESKRSELQVQIRQNESAFAESVVKALNELPRHFPPKKGVSEEQFKASQELLCTGKKFKSHLEYRSRENVFFQLPPTCLPIASENLRAKHRFMLSMLQKYPGHTTILKSIPQNLKEDPEFIMAAVKLHGRVLTYVDSKFLLDKKILLVALQTHPQLITFDLVKSHFANDVDVFMEVAKQDPMLAMVSLSSNLKHHEGILKVALQNMQAFDLFCLDKSYFQDLTFMQIAAPIHGSVLKFASDSIKANKSVVLAAVKNDPSAIQYARESLQNDPDVMLSYLAWV